MRLGYDLSILRHPRAGTARYAEELLATWFCPSEDCLEGRAAYAFAAISIWRRISPGGVSAVRPSRPGPV